MTPYRLPSSRPASSRAGAFTLIEILVVIGIILLLSAILFPAFKSIQERGAQTTCASNMQQLYLAVRLYKDDEREYPANLAALLPDTETLEDTATNTNKAPNIEGTGYFRKTREELVCPDDDTQVLDPVASAGGDPPVTPVRSSYGDTSNAPTKSSNTSSSETLADANATPWDASTGAHNAAFYGAGDTRDWGRLAWNYWGYDDWGQAFRSQDEALSYAKGTTNLTKVSRALRDYDPNLSPPTNTKQTPSGSQGYKADATYTVGGPFPAPSYYFNPRGFVRDMDGSGNPVGGYYEEPRAANMWKYSLSNPQAPLGTIITHCAYHRIQTGTNLFAPSADQLYSTDASKGFDGTGARDIILRLDGTARSYDVTKWNQEDFPRAKHGSNWQISDF